MTLSLVILGVAVCLSIVLWRMPEENLRVRGEWYPELLDELAAVRKEAADLELRVKRLENDKLSFVRRK